MVLTEEFVPSKKHVLPELHRVESVEVHVQDALVLQLEAVPWYRVNGND